MAASSSSKKNKIDCISFCGCPDIPVKEIEEIVNSNLRTENSRKLFRAFADEEPEDDTRKTLIALEIYELCDKTKKANSGQNEDTVKQIRILCGHIFSPKQMRELFGQEIDSAEPNLDIIMKHSENYYLCDTDDYKRFTNALLEKMKRWKKSKPDKKCMIL